MTWIEMFKFGFIQQILMNIYCFQDAILETGYSTVTKKEKVFHMLTFVC